MNKPLLYFSIIFILLPVGVFATSGACSWHGGVNCSLSNASYSIVCNDGSNDSSTSYSNLSECQNVSCDVGAVGAWASSRGLLGKPMGDSIISRCKQFNQNLQNIQPIITYPSSVLLPSPIQVQNPLIQYNLDCQNKYSVFSIFNISTNRCECQSGYAPNNEIPFKCIPLNLYCSQEAGQGATNLLSTYSDGSGVYVNCKCLSGYVWNSNNTQCVVQPSPDDLNQKLIQTLLEKVAQLKQQIQDILNKKK